MVDLWTRERTAKYYKRATHIDPMSQTSVEFIQVSNRFSPIRTETQLADRSLVTK
jgi:hypothetical protein